MEILKNAGSFVILQSENELKKQLKIIEKAGRTCYQSERGPITMRTARKFCKMLMRRGHYSVLEHSLMTVQFNNASRGFTHEQVRHRLTAISQESTRYVDYAKDSLMPDLDQFQAQFIAPPHRDENQIVTLEDGRKMTLVQMFAEIERFYRALRKADWDPQDARQILPIGLKSQIVISANFREWLHIFSMRTTKPAHWEIRKIMCDLLETIQKPLSPIFGEFEFSGVDQNGLRYCKLAA